MILILGIVSASILLVGIGLLVHGILTAPIGEETEFGLQIVHEEDDFAGIFETAANENRTDSSQEEIAGARYRIRLPISKVSQPKT